MPSLSIPNVLTALAEMRVTHLVWIPDSCFGAWEVPLERSPVQLIRVCREGEAWPLAAGLLAGGATPLIVMQSTGLFESGDALRNVLYDLRCPLYAWIGIRNWLHPQSTDSARTFALPIIQAWGIEHVWVQQDDDLHPMVRHYWACKSASRAGAALVAEGSG
jgi:sulfopyruvate decarboxylase TPP-binding subunit